VEREAFRQHRTSDEFTPVGVNSGKLGRRFAVRSMPFAAATIAYSEKSRKIAQSG
jgi:hypothetical protein